MRDIRINRIADDCFVISIGTTRRTRIFLNEADFNQLVRACQSIQATQAYSFELRITESI